MRRVVVIVGILLLLFGVGGFFSVRWALQQLQRPKETTVQITTAWPGADALSVSAQITRMLEHAVMTHDRIVETRGISTEGLSMVLATFEGVEAFAALSEVRSLVQKHATYLPEDAEQPIMMLLYERPSVRYSLTSEVHTAHQLREIQEQVRRTLLKQPGILNVESCAGREVIEVKLSAERSQALGITRSRVRTALTLGSSRLLRTVKEIGDQIIPTKDGKTVRVADLATIRLAERPGDCRFVANGRVVAGGIVTIREGFDDRLLDDVLETVPPEVVAKRLGPTLAIHVEVQQAKVGFGIPAQGEQEILLSQWMGKLFPEHAHLVRGTMVYLERKAAKPRDIAERLSAIADPHIGSVEVEGVPTLVGELMGPDQQELLRSIERVAKVARSEKNLSVSMPNIERRPETVLEIDREAIARFGLTMAEVTQVMRNVPIVGSPTIEITDEREERDRMNRLVPTNNGLVPLSQLATISLRESMVQHTTLNGQRMVAVRIAIHDKQAKAVARRIQDQVAAQALAAGYAIRWRWE